MTTREELISETIEALKSAGITLDEAVERVPGSEIIDGLWVPNPSTWTADDGNVEVEYDSDSGEEAAQLYVDEGSWGNSSETQWVKVYYWRVGYDEDGDEQQVYHGSYLAEVEPDEPECSADEHDWCSPIEVVHGCVENPGVYGHGGGVIITEVCRHCGIYRETDTWAQDRSSGRQGLESIAYRDADEQSLAWIASLDGETAA